MFKNVYIAVSLLLLCGCVTQPATKPRSAINNIAMMRDWSAQGRMGIVGIAQSGSGRFIWQQHGDVSQVNLHGPLGAGAVSVTLSDVLHLTLSNGVHYDADDALRELEARLGAAVPVKQLSYWLRGIPAPGEFAWNNDGNKVLQQDGWRVEYSDSMQIDQLVLPRKITATHDQVRIRVVIEEWQLR